MTAAIRAPARVVITGATGSLGRALATDLRQRGHAVVAVVRPGAAGRAPHGTEVAEVDVLDGANLARVFAPADTVVHLVGTPRPGPAKGRPPRLRERGPSRAGDAGLHRRADGRRTPGARQRRAGDDPAAVVRAGTGPLVAVRAATLLRAGAAAALDARDR